MRGESLFFAQHELEQEPYSMRVNPLGARIEEVVLGGFPILVSVQRGDGKHASTHPCTPIFGPETHTSFGLPQHGAMRNSLCQVMHTGAREIELSHDIHEGTYPEGVRVRQVFKLIDDKFYVMTFHVNEEKDPAPVNFAEHLYWNAPYGWEGLKVNGEDVTEAVKNDGIISLKDQSLIQIPGMPEILLGQINLPYANLWAYQNPETGNYDNHYVCIEPVQHRPEEFGSAQTMLYPVDKAKRVGFSASSFCLEIA